MTHNEDDLTERISGEVLAVYTTGYDREVADTRGSAARIIALVRSHDRKKSLTVRFDPEQMVGIMANTEEYAKQFEAGIRDEAGGTAER